MSIVSALPLLEVPEGHGAGWVLHPLNDLELSGEVDIVVGGGNEGHPLVEDLGESLVGDQPGGVEREGEGSPVGAVVALKVVVQQLPAKQVLLCTSLHLSCCKKSDLILACLRHSIQTIPELVLVVNVAAGGHKMATSETLVKVRVVTSVKLVDWHLPDGVASAWTVSRVAVALVWHPEKNINFLSAAI